MLEEASQAIEAFRAGFPMAFLAVVPVIFMVMSPIAVVDAAHEFTVYRMQQYDLQGNSYGCRSSLVNAEARTIHSSSYARKCVLIRSSELTHTKYLEVVDGGPSAIVVLLCGNMSNGQIQNFIEMENELLSTDSSIPVYFANEDQELNNVYDRVTHSTKVESSSALQAMVDAATSVGYQLVTVGAASKSMPDHSIVNIEGFLPGLGIEDQLPTVAVVAHSDSFGVAPYLSYGANSDASGVVVLLELARVLGKLYRNSRTHPKHNVLFLLSGGGKFNYQGTRRWIEEALDNSASSSIDNPSSALLSSASLVLCLEGLALDGTNSLRMHVSKPPAKGTVADALYKNIEKFGGGDVDVSLVHKKIRLSSDSLAWEHERFSIRRLPAVTLSSFENHDHPIRRSIMDRKDKISMETLVKNTAIITESLVSYLYNTTDDNMLNFVSGDYGIQKERMQTWMDFLVTSPRPAQALHEDHPVVTALEAELNKHTKGVHKQAFKADKRDPDFMFYDGLVLQMSASIVRSAAFDLYMTGAVAAYLAVIYFLVLKFNGVLSIAKKFNSLPKVKVQ
ncbi:BOS complex subunit ncln-like [Clavelina lepadiformis]|uniref:BOS complex subunit ncln-like n=1 Tax=Clavelina lepadiformis TaxID=159417 RepID=UPI0040435452